MACEVFGGSEFGGRWWRRLLGTTLFLALGALGCSREKESPPEEVARSAEALSATTIRTYGFESLSDWSAYASTPTLSLSTTHVQGSSSLSVAGGGWSSIRSRILVKEDPTPTTVGFDLRIPSPQPNPTWFGTVQLFVSIPSQNINDLPLGNLDLITWTPGQFKRAEFALPANVQAALNTNFTDLRWRIELNRPTTATAGYLFDRFTYGPLCTPQSDNNACTTDACDANGNQVHTPVAAGTSCSDNNACNGAETCNANGTCVAGTPPNLNDNNPCTTDACTPAGGVTHTPVAAGTSCTDGNACNGAETCNASAACQAGTPPVVNDNNPCTTDACNPATGVTHTPVAAGTSCADADQCNGAEVCNASGSCVGGTPITCTASDQCHNAGTCNPSTGVCSNPAKTNGSVCTDGSACTQTDTCQSGICTGANPVVCVASDQCHNPGTCNASNGACSNPEKPNGSSCSDGNACTQTDACQAGTCTGTNPVVCVASNSCHDPGTCAPSTGTCSNPAKPNGTACDDTTVCNGSETCTAGTCTAGTPPTTDDGNPCTADACDAVAGVTHTPVATGTSCSDANACNGSETCNGTGTCVAGTPVVCTASDQCHDAGTCNPASGTCSTPAKADGSPCPDGTVCNGSETCSSGTCVAGPPPATDDNNPCTADACDPITGVSHTPVSTGTSCSNGNACDGSETCNGTGTCVAGTPPTLDDGNPCTADACDASGGVTHTPSPTGTNCGDDNLCNGNETCNGFGACTPGTPPDTDDHNPCTADTCDPFQGAVHTPVPSGTSCSDFDACNGSELCDAAGACQPGTPVSTEDGNSCTSGTCDPLTGTVTQSPVPAGTECFIDTCTLGACNPAGECTASGSTVVDDGDPCTIEWCDPVLGPQMKRCSDIDRTVGTTLQESMKWIYEQPNPPQVGVAPGTIEVKRAVGLRGRVETRDGNPLPGAEVTILGHPEFGYTFTHSDGYFDMVVNGGGALTLEFAHENHLRTQRQVATDWDEHVLVETVVMIPPDAVATPVDLTNPSEAFQVAQGSIQSDEDGDRQGTLLVPAGVEATMHLEDGATMPLSSVSVRITEFTVGQNGPETMPGQLPVESRYTYAFEVNADEAIEANAPSITFSAPLFYYVQNFLGFVAGTPVPVGSFRRDTGAWIPEKSGIVLDIVGETAGLAEIDFTGDGAPEDSAALATLGISDEERARLAELYQPGHTLWRVPISHFTTPWDANMAGGPPPNATGPYGNNGGNGGSGGSSGSGGSGGSAGTNGGSGGSNGGSGGSNGGSGGSNGGSGGTSGSSGEGNGGDSGNGGSAGNNGGSGGSNGGSGGSNGGSGGSSGSSGQGNGGGSGDGGSGGFGASSGSGGSGGLDEEGGPRNEDGNGRCPSKLSGASTIVCESQILGESIPIAGTPYTLNYSSARVPGFRGGNRIRIPLSKGAIPEGVQKIVVDVSIAGQRHHEEFPAAPNQVTTFTWDGRDVFGRELQGQQQATVSIGYVYLYTYTKTDRFGYNGNGLAITVDTEPAPPGEFIERCTGSDCNPVPAPGRTTIALAAKWTVPVGSMDMRPVGAMGGWTFDVHHALGFAARTLDLGDGRRLDHGVLPNGVKQMTQANLPTGSFTIAPDGNIFLGSGTRVYRIVGRENPVPFAGNGNTTAYAGEGLPAADPGVGIDARDVALASDGSVYIADFTNHIVRRVDPEGIINTVAGIPTVRGVSGFDIVAANGSATSTAMTNPRSVVVAPDGSIFVATLANIVKITTDGQLVNVAGTEFTSVFARAPGSPPDGQVATEVTLQPMSLAVAPDGTLYAVLTGCNPEFTVCDGIGTVVVKFVDGIMYRVAGSGCVGSCQTPWTNGDRALTANIRPTGIAFDRSGTLYFSDIAGTPFETYERVATITNDGFVYAAAGIRGGPFSPGSALRVADGSPATNALFEMPGSGAYRPIATGPGGLHVLTRVFPGGSGGTSAILRTTTLLPDHLGVASFTPAQGADAVYAFDPFGRHMSTIHSLTGSSLTEIGYDGAGRITSITDEAGKVTTIERTSQGTPLAVVAPFGQRTELELDSNGYLSRVTDPEGQVTAMGYSNGLLTSFTNARQLTSTMQYDSLGRLQLDTDAASGTHSLSRTETTASWSVTDATALGRTTSYATKMDGANNDTKTVTHPDGTQTVTKSGTNQVTSTAQPDGTTITSSVVPDSRLGMNRSAMSQTTILPSGLSSVRTQRRIYQGLDPNDFLAFTSYEDQTTVNGRLWRTFFDAADLTYTTISPSSRSKTRRIDAVGRTSQTQVSGLFPIDFFYDSSGRPDHVTQGTRTSQNAYFSLGAAAGYLESIVDATGVPTTFTRDALGRMLTETRAAATTGFTWDPVSNLASVTPPGKPTHAMSYSPVNLLGAYSPPPAGLATFATSYTYDADRMLRTEQRPNAVTITRAPDAAGRLDTVAFPGGLLNYDYYPPGTPSGAGKTSDIRGPYGVDLHFTYDGSLTTSSSWSGDVTGSIDFQYNNDFQKLRETVNGASGTASTAFGYDNDMLLTCASPTTCSPAGADALTLTRSPQHGMVTNLALGQTSETWSHNGYGELARQTAQVNGSPLIDIIYDEAGFERDQLGRVVRKTETILGSTRVFEYHYDELRRLDRVTIDGVVDEEFTYDNNGNRLTAYRAGVGTLSATYDDQDRLLTYGDWTFTYTANGELETKTNTATGHHWMFQYDALGNLLSVVLPNGDLVEYLVDGMGRRVAKKKNGVFLKQWIYRDSLKPVAELDGVGALVSEFVYGSNPNVPDYVRRGSTTYRVISDQLGSPRYVININNAIDVPVTANYTSFGEVTGTGLDWMPFRFAGGIYDVDTGLTRFGARDYAPEFGRWLSKDGIRWRGRQGNFYVYVGNDPINRIDPTGQDWSPNPACPVDIIECAGVCANPRTRPECGYCLSSLARDCDLIPDEHPGPPVPPGPPPGCPPGSHETEASKEGGFLSHFECVPDEDLSGSCGDTCDPSNSSCI